MTVMTPASNVLSRLMNFFFAIVIAALAALFWITILSPGNEVSGWIFDLIRPITNICQALYEFFGYPIRLLCSWIAGFLPPAALTYFPTTTVRAIVTGVLDLLGIIPGFTSHPATQSIYHWNFESWFPGIVDWQILFTISFVGFIADVVDRTIGFFAASFGGFRGGRTIEANSINQEQPVNSWQQNSHFTPQPVAQNFPQPYSNPAPLSHRQALDNVIGVDAGFDEPVGPPDFWHQQSFANSPELDPETGLMSRHAFQLQYEQLYEEARQRHRPLGLVWLEVSTLAVTPAETLLQLGRWLNNMTLKEGRNKERIIPVRYGAHSIVVLLPNHRPDQARQVGLHLAQRLNEFRFAPLVGLSHNQDLDTTSSQTLLQNAYQKAIEKAVSVSLI
ncbi:MAG: hypothetical protein VKJ04_10045 [Vampirovibrionales bacterium]|nr:hypothetical protein [Vampirovibrionales bacterium]